MPVSNINITPNIYIRKNEFADRDQDYCAHITGYKRVTSYSPRAIEKALHCAFLAIIRHTVERYNPNESASDYKEHDKDIEIIKEAMLKRVGEVAPEMQEYAGQWLDYYLKCWKDLASIMPDSLVYYNYQNEDISLFKRAGNDSGTEIPTILNSVRNVEQSADIFFTKR